MAMQHYGDCMVSKHGIDGGCVPCVIRVVTVYTRRIQMNTIAPIAPATHPEHGGGVIVQLIRPTSRIKLVSISPTKRE